MKFSRYFPAVLFCLCSTLFSQGLVIEDPRDLEKQEQAITKQLAELKNAYSSHKDVLAIQTELVKAKHDFTRFKNTFEPVTNAFKAMYAAKDALWATVEEVSKTDPGIQSLMQKKELSEGKRRELRYQLDLAMFELDHLDSPINRILDGDPNLAALSMGQEPPDVENDAQKKWMIETPYPLVRKAVRELMPEYQALRSSIMSVSNQLNQAVQDAHDTSVELSQAQINLYKGGNPVCTAAKVKLDSSMGDVRKAYQTPEMKVFETDIKTREDAWLAKIEELAMADPKATPLLEQLEKLQERRRVAIQALQKSSEFKAPE